MQFYLVLPLVFFIQSRKFILIFFLILIIGMTSFVTFKLVTTDIRQSLYFATYGRIPEFGLGVVVALVRPALIPKLRHENLLSGLGIVLIVFSLLVMDDKTPFPGIAAMVPCLGVALILLVQSCVINNVLAMRFPVWIGALSYSLYLWHWPILATLRYMQGTYDLSWSILLLFCLLTYAFAYISYRFVEQPFRSMSFLKAFVLLCAMALVALELISNSGRLNGYAAKTVTLEQGRYAVAAEICHGTIVGQCLQGDISASQDVLVIGDSHAAQLNYFFDEIGKKLGVRARVLSAVGCVPIEGFDIPRIPEAMRAACTAQTSSVQPFIEQATQIVVAGRWEMHFKSPAFIASLEAFLLRQTQAGKRVLILAQIPMFNSNVHRLARFESIGIPAYQSMNADWMEANKRIADVARRVLNVTFLDLSSDSFFATIPFENGTLIYMDSDHLNEAGTRRYAIPALPVFKRWLKAP
jgi:hypothetical protein